MLRKKNWKWHFYRCKTLLEENIDVLEEELRKKVIITTLNLTT